MGLAAPIRTRFAPIRPNTCQTSDVPLNIVDDSTKHASSYSFYLQDEWKIIPTLTVNFGVRYDKYRRL